MRILETGKVLKALGTTRGLLECETLTSDEICNLLNGHPPVQDSGDTLSSVRGSAVPTAGRGRPHVIGGRLRPQPEG
jgi:cell division protease FtsH